MQSISVIIPTYNGEKKLPNLLSALEKQSISGFEVVIVSDGSTDHTSEVVQGNKWNLDIRFLTQENKGRSATRNKSAANAKNELLVFFDDDMRPLPNCVEEHLKHHTEYPGSIVTGGLMEEVTPSSSELFNYKSFLSHKWLAQYKSEGSKLLTRKQFFMTTANFSIPKTLFNQVGGFDERLTDTEDYDFAVRAYKMNVPLYYKYKAFAWHDDIINASIYIKRQRQYYEAQAKLKNIHPEWEVEQFLQPKYTPTGLKASVFKLFCSESWIEAIDKDKLKWLPTAIRYRLYDYIITANGAFFPDRVQL